jgi:hypothetical protein
LGRFINRDPIEEQGGLNLYAFVRNNAVNAWDYLGMWGAEIIGMDGGGSVAANLEGLIARASDIRSVGGDGDPYALLAAIHRPLDGSPVEAKMAADEAFFMANFQEQAAAVAAAYWLRVALGVESPKSHRLKESVTIGEMLITGSGTSVSLSDLAPNRAGTSTTTGSGAPVQVVEIPGVGTVVVNKYDGGAGKRGSQLTLDFDFKHSGGKDQYGVLQTVTTDTFQQIKTPYADPINGPKYYDDGITSVPRPDPGKPVYDLKTGTMVPGFQMLPSREDGILRFHDTPTNPASSTALYGSLSFRTVIVVRGSDTPVATITWGYSNQTSGYSQQPLVITPTPKP